MKLKVKDSKGKILKVTDACVEDDEKEAEELTKADVKKLKRLLPHLDDLLQLLELEQQEHDKDFFDDEIESVINAEAVKAEKEDADDVDETEEAVVEEEKVEDDDAELKAQTQNVKTVNDSKKSFGAIERRKVADSIETEIDRDNEVALAWAKRYNGGN